MSIEKQTFGVESITELPCWQGAKQCLCEIECEDCIESHLLAAGWRKQEWISVEERLPEVDTNVLVITASGSFKVARCNIYKNGTLVLWATNDGLGERAITHWMPLPDPPTMRKEDEGK